MEMAERVQRDTEILVSSVIEKVMKRPPVAFDFKVAAAVVHLLATLPPSHGMTSVVKTLKGTSKATKKNPKYGWLEGVEAYKASHLQKMTESLITTFEKAELLKFERYPYQPVSGANNAPEWITRRVFSSLEGMLLPDYIESLAVENNLTVQEPERLPKA